MDLTKQVDFIYSLVNHQFYFQKINNPPESTIEKVLEMCQEVLNKQKDLEMSNLEIVDKLRSAEDEIKKLSKEQQEKFDSIQSDLNEINQTLKPEEPSKMEENDDSADITALVNLTQVRISVLFSF